MKFRIKDIGAAERREVAELAIDGLPLLMDLTASGGVRFTAPVSVDILLVRQGVDTVLVTGALHTRAAMNCSRCLAETTTDIHAQFRILFEPGADEAVPPDDAAASTEMDMERACYEAEAIDVIPAIQEEVLAALPIRLLCRDDCKGLCPGCGADLNCGACGCKAATVDPRLAALKNWKA